MSTPPTPQLGHGCLYVFKAKSTKTTRYPTTNTNPDISHPWRNAIILWQLYTESQNICATFVSWTNPHVKRWPIFNNFWYTTSWRNLMLTYTVLSISTYYCCYITLWNAKVVVCFLTSSTCKCDRLVISESEIQELTRCCPVAENNNLVDERGKIYYTTTTSWTTTTPLQPQKCQSGKTTGDFTFWLTLTEPTCWANVLQCKYALKPKSDMISLSLSLSGNFDLSP